jgi:hypothetical protein
VLADHPALQQWTATMGSFLEYPFVSGEQKSETNLQRVVIDFVNDMLARFDRFDAPKVEQHATQLIQGLVDGVATFETGAIVYSFNSEEVPDQADSQRIEVGSGMEIRAANGAWASERFYLAERIPHGSWAVVAGGQVELRSSDILFNSSLPAEDETELLERSLLGIRLVLPFPTLLSEPYRLGQKGPRSPARKVEYDAAFHDEVRGPWSGVTKEQLVELGVIGRILSTRMARGPGRTAADVLDLALRSFNRAFQRKRAEWSDRLLDISIVFEALFVRETGEISHKSATRAALLLGRSHENSLLIFQTVKSLYDLRSAIVHASHRQLEKKCRAICESYFGSREPYTGPGDPLVQYGVMASAAGLSISAQALRAFLHLSQAGFNPMSQSFLRLLDGVAFSQGERERLQSMAAVFQEEEPDQERDSAETDPSHR